MQHYSVNIDATGRYMPLGPTIARNWLLESEGWPLVIVPGHEWWQIETLDKQVR